MCLVCFYCRRIAKKIKLSYDNVKTNAFSNLELHEVYQKEKELIQRSVKNIYLDFIQHVSEGENVNI